MKLVLISDTHGFKPDIPDGDVLIHAGDLTMQGTEYEVEEALYWLNSLPHPNKVIIAGNHDFLFEQEPNLSKWILGKYDLTYLENSSFTINGIKFYGSPVQPWFHDWAFNVIRGDAIQKYWDLIPNDTDVLITHGPPLGILDQSNPSARIIPLSGKLDDTVSLGPSEHLGCGNLLTRISKVKPKIHVFGHIHGGYGKHQTKFGTVCYNASILDEAYELANEPWVVNIGE